VPALAAFYLYAFRSRRRLLERFASRQMLARLTAGVSRPRQAAKAVLVLLGLATALLSLAEVQWGFTWEEVKRQGVDIVIALDVSDSMLVEDAEAGGKLPRLLRAKREIVDLLRLLEGDRIGLVAFAGTAFVECPLTLDYSAAEVFLETLDTELIPVKGTAIGEAIRTSLTAFEGSSHPSRAIILITDGEDHSGEALAAAEEAKAAGVRIFPIGIGRDEGSPIPAAGGGFRRDRGGEIILSRLDEPTLQKVALATGGRYVRSVTGDVDLEQIYHQGIKATMEEQELGSRRRQRWEERFQWVLALALLALMLEPLVPERRRRKEAALALALLSVILLPWRAEAQAPAAAGPPPGAAAAEATRQQAAAPRIEDPYRAYEAGLYDQALAGFLDLQLERPEDPALALNLGNAHYRMRDWEAAGRAFGEAAMAADPSVRQQAVYSLGNVAFRQGRLGEAVELYKAALELDPDDEDAKFNLEFVRDEIRRRHEEAKKQQRQPPGQQDQQPPQGQQEQQEQPGQQDGQAGREPPPQPAAGEQPPGADQGQGGETDPKRADSDGDGVPDAEEAPRPEPGQERAGEAAAERGMTPEEAERFLRALSEGRPELRRAAPGRRVRTAKDW
jgi:Ca-activated chloride channel family protein